MDHDKAVMNVVDKDTHEDLEPATTHERVPDKRDTQSLLEPAAKHPAGPGKD